MNFCPVKKPDNVSDSDMTAADRKGLERFEEFNTTGNAYLRFHGTKPATIGLVLSASPVAVLAWCALALHPEHPALVVDSY